MTNKNIIDIEDGLVIDKDNVIAVFSNTSELDSFISQISDAVASDSYSLDTDKGRKEIASRAYKVSRMKTKLSQAAKDSVSSLKSTISKVNGGINYLSNELDKLRDETRKPLTEWEDAEREKEEERISSIQERMQLIHNAGSYDSSDTIDSLSTKISSLSTIDVTDGFDEYCTDALKLISELKESLTYRISEITNEIALEEERQKAKSVELELQKERERIRELEAQLLSTVKKQPDSEEKSDNVDSVDEDDVEAHSPELVAMHRLSVSFNTNVSLLSQSQLKEIDMHIVQGLESMGFSDVSVNFQQ